MPYRVRRARLQGEAPVLRLRLLALERVLGPHALAVQELGLPGLDVAVQVGDQLVLLVAHARAEVRDAQVRLLAVPQVRLRAESEVSENDEVSPSGYMHWLRARMRTGKDPPNR